VGVRVRTGEGERGGEKETEGGDEGVGETEKGGEGWRTRKRGKQEGGGEERRGVGETKKGGEEGGVIYYSIRSVCQYSPPHDCHMTIP